MDKRALLDKAIATTTQFLNISGTLHGNGWGNESHRKAAHQFKSVFNELEGQYILTMVTYEEFKPHICRSTAPCSAWDDVMQRHHFLSQATDVVK